MLNVYELERTGYVLRDSHYFPEVGLGLQIWEGSYEGLHQPWLRWCSAEGGLIATGAERAEQAETRAEQERERAERLAAKLRALGIDPDEV